MQKRLIYINAGFDYELGCYPVELLRRRINEVSLFAVALSKPGDIVISETAPKAEFIDYLYKKGISVSDDFRSTGDERLTAVDDIILWGENQQALSVVAKYLQAKSTDSQNYFETVKLLNSRAFSASLQQELNLPVKALVFESPEDVKNYLKTAKLPVVIKSNFGCSASGFIIAESRNLCKRGLLKLEAMFPEINSAVTVEPWEKRLFDFSCGFSIDKTGRVLNPLYNLLDNHKKGFFNSVVVSDSDELLAKILTSDNLSQLRQLMTEVAERSHQRGYTGYIGIDGFVYKSENLSQLEINYSCGNLAEKKVMNPLCEINARNTMAKLANDFKKRISLARYVSLVTFNSRQLSFLKDYSDIEEFSKPYSFPISGKNLPEGVILLTPLFYSAGEKSLSLQNRDKIRNKYLIFACISDSYEDIVKMKDHLIKKC